LFAAGFFRLFILAHPPDFEPFFKALSLFLLLAQSLELAEVLAS
jgi:hypothetical protein